ncbi:Phosphotransferase enzyme family protein [Pleurostoma richardsiae]|uniref:Phosphotransferase enzyme family protein n=1 Tax=Pleurostoma richardsiae TaxID=41990 RepID=A0AA38R9R4_9PEZI|nr:Phosphotransferase enzyme family protein [Pleurostoma richardsiae]
MRVNKDALATNKKKAQDWLTLLATYDHYYAPRSRVETIASQHRQGRPCRVVQRIRGAFNYCFRIRFDEGDDEWVLRFPVPGDTMNAMRKVQNEAAVMRFLKDNTTIPVPELITSGVAHGEFEGLGPYIIMNFVDGVSLDDVLLEGDSSLKKDIPDPVLETIYRQIANIYLQLFQLDFSKIGSLSVVEEAGMGRRWHVTSGPVTFKMNEIERMGGVRVGASDGPFDSATDYFHTLAEQSLSHLLDNPLASRDEQEARDDYRSIHILRTLAERFASNDTGHYKLFCDDLRFGNILVDRSNRILAVLDWEFSYAAPASFLYSPPSWLIGSEPFEWKDEDVRIYKGKVEIFLRLLEEEEDCCGLGRTLSSLMRESMRDGTFWYNLAIRESFPLADLMEHCLDAEPFSEVAPPDDLETFGRRKMARRQEYEEHKSLKQQRQQKQIAEVNNKTPGRASLVARVAAIGVCSQSF